MLYNPVSYLLFFLVTIFLIPLENPIGWGGQYTTTYSNSLFMPVLYVVSFILVYFLICKISTKNTSNDIGFSIKGFLLLSLIVSVFQIGKLIHIGDIPLFGDQLSRYRMSLSGLADYPSRLLPALFWVSVALYINKKNNLFILIGFLLLFLCTLLMQRQDIVFAVVGAIIMLTINKRMNFSKIIIISLLGIVVAYLIGYGAVIRYGANNINSNINIFMLPVWIVHAELTVPAKLSLYVIERIGDSRLYGLYTLSSFYDLITSGMQTGAIYIRDKYVGAQTAQSLSAPFSYFIDFGYAGVIIAAIINSGISTYLYIRSRYVSSYFYSALYAFIFLHLFLSIRSGTLVFSPITIYTAMAMISLTTGGSYNFNVIRRISIIILYSSLSLSAISLFASI